MSQLTHASVQFVRSHRSVTLAWLLALGATVTIVLILAIGSDATDEPVAPSVATVQSQSGGHPEESDVAAAVTGSGSSAFDSHPDETGVAAAVSGR